MNKSGISTVTQFVLLGSPGPWKVQIILFSMIFLVYILTLSRNMAIICAVLWDNQLYTLMYMLLANFFLEIWYVTCTVPNMLVNFLSKTKTISFSACFTHFCFFFPLGTTKCFFLSVMAYDQYLAICCPLHYPSVLLDSSVPFSYLSVGSLGSLDIQLLFSLFSTIFRWSQHHWSHSLWCGPTNCPMHLHSSSSMFFILWALLSSFSPCCTFQGHISWCSELCFRILLQLGRKRSSLPVDST